MSCAAGGTIPLSRVTRGLITEQQYTALSIVTKGVGSAVPDIAVLSITITNLTDGATNVPRNSILEFTMADDNPIVKEANSQTYEWMHIRYRQVPYPAQSADGWVTAYCGFQRLPTDTWYQSKIKMNATDMAADPVTGVDYGHPKSWADVTDPANYLQRQFLRTVLADGTHGFAVTSSANSDNSEVYVKVVPRFPMMPGAAITWQIKMKDCFGVETTKTLSMTADDSASTVTNRTALYSIQTQAASFGWEGVLTSKTQWTWDADSTTYTGSQIGVYTNESLLMHMSDELTSEKMATGSLQYMAAPHPDYPTSMYQPLGTAKSPETENGGIYGLEILNTPRRYRTLGKDGGWSETAMDPLATLLEDKAPVGSSYPTPIISDFALPGAITQMIHTDLDINRQAGEWRYYSTFILLSPTTQGTDWYWGHTDSFITDTYSYGKGSHGSLMYDLLPAYIRMDDGKGE